MFTDQQPLESLYYIKCPHYILRVHTRACHVNVQILKCAYASNVIEGHFVIDDISTMI